MGEIRIVGPGKTHGYSYPVCKKLMFEILTSRQPTTSLVLNNRALIANTVDTSREQV